MNQPELGKKIHELRNQKGITQKELSEHCNVDIRTIQRIESGEVSPRMSTLRLIAASLESDEILANGVSSGQPSGSVKILLLFTALAGVIHFINWFFYVPLIPEALFRIPDVFRLAFSLVFVLFGVFFYFGFVVLGKLQKNKVLIIAALIIMLLIPLSVISEIAANFTSMGFMHQVQKISIILMSVNGITLGAGLLFAKSNYKVIYKLAGIFQLLITPFFLIPVSLIQLSGLYMSVPFLILLVLIQFFEFSDLKFAA